MNTHPRSAYGSLPDRLRAVDRNADNGWGGFQWSPSGRTRVPAELLATASYRHLRLLIRRELVELTVLMWKIAEAVGYTIHSENPDGSGESWGPWGYEDRPIGGTQSPSNHSRGRAEDDNAPWNPMTTDFVAEIDPRYVRAREECGFFWGGRYLGKTDTMHFEYVGRPEDVEADLRRARRLLEELSGPDDRRASADTTRREPPPAPVPDSALPPIPIPDKDDDMIRLVKLAGSDKVWCVDIGAHTRWHVATAEQLTFLNDLGVQGVVGVQPPTYLDGFRDISS